jgi:hypothetical protein
VYTDAIMRSVETSPGIGGRRGIMEGLNLTKIYSEHFCTPNTTII